jgi:transcriptional regulator with XRE-family HTH domain
MRGKNHIGQRIRLARLSKGWTQEDLAEKINKTRPMISHIERTGSITFDTLEQVAKGLGIELADLQNVSSEQILAPSTMDSPEWKALVRENELLAELVENQRVRILYLETELKRWREIH